MERDEWEKFLLNKTWWLDLSDESCNTVVTTIHGVQLTMTQAKMSSLEIKHNKRARLLIGG